MMLTDLLEAVAATDTLPTSQLANYKTSIGYLARALQCPDAQHCPQDVFAQSQKALRHVLDTYLGSLQPPPSSHTVRNTRYNIRTLFKKASEAHILQPDGLLPKTPQAWTTLRRTTNANSPYKKHFNQPRYRLPLEAWPLEILTFWNRYSIETRRTIRPVTLNIAKSALSSYLGYFHNIVHEPVTVWDDLFSLERLDAYVTWHGERLGVRCSTWSRHVVTHLICFAMHFKYPQIKALKDYRKTLPPPSLCITSMIFCSAFMTLNV